MENKKHIPCIICRKKATWSYSPGDENYCDNCVPRGCSCNRELKEGIDYDSKEAENPDNYYERLDEKGRLIPCCEFCQISEDDHKNKKWLDFGWKTYYKYNPNELNDDEEETEKWEKKLERK